MFFNKRLVALSIFLGSSLAFYAYNAIRTIGKTENLVHSEVGVKDYPLEMNLIDLGSFDLEFIAISTKKNFCELFNGQTLIGY